MSANPRDFETIHQTDCTSIPVVPEEGKARQVKNRIVIVIEDGKVVKFLQTAVAASQLER